LKIQRKEKNDHAFFKSNMLMECVLNSMRESGHSNFLKPHPQKAEHKLHVVTCPPITILKKLEHGFYMWILPTYVDHRLMLYDV
jgi:hypothetical protein